MPFAQLSDLCGSPEDRPKSSKQIKPCIRSCYQYIIPRTPLFCDNAAPCLADHKPCTVGRSAGMRVGTRTSSRTSMISVFSCVPGSLQQSQNQSNHEATGKMTGTYDKAAKPYPSRILRSSGGSMKITWSAIVISAHQNVALRSRNGASGVLPPLVSGGSDSAYLPAIL